MIYNGFLLQYTLRSEHTITFDDFYFFVETLLFEETSNFRLISNGRQKVFGFRRFSCFWRHSLYGHGDESHEVVVLTSADRMRWSQANIPLDKSTF